MATPDRVQTTITLEDAGKGTVALTLVFGNGDTVTCIYAFDDESNVTEAAQAALDSAYEMADMLPIMPDPDS